MEVKESYFAMSFEVKNSKAAYITDPIDMNSKFSEKVDNSLTRIWKREPQNEWSCQDAENFFETSHNFQVVEGTKLSFYLYKSNLLGWVDTSSECNLPFQWLGQ